MADIDPKRPFSQKRHAGYVELCSQHDHLCYGAYLYLLGIRI